LAMVVCAATAGNRGASQCMFVPHGGIP
jgi:hypothetical protein